MAETPETPGTPDLSRIHIQPANGFKNVSVEGSNNISPVLHDTIGTVFLGIISLILLFKLCKVYDEDRKRAKCGCECCKSGKCECGKKEEAT